jgi:uncharacterized protein involved in exopolysaccharide biosynthesis
VESDSSDVVSENTILDRGFVYNPYFIQTTFEIIQSQLVLSNVIATLNLNEVWGKKYASGKTLLMSETMELIKPRMALAPVRNARLIALSFTSTDPNEAAQIANAIAVSYRDYRVALRIQADRKGMEIFEEQYRTAEQQISNQQTKVEQLRLKYGIQDLAATNGAAEAQPYWDEKRKLDGMREQQTLLAKKIEMSKLELEIPKTLMVILTDPATPPAHSAGPNRPLGAVLLVLSLCSCAVGWRWLQASAPPPLAN